MRKKAQSFIEYTLLVLAVSAAILAMSKYVQRAMNYRFATVRQEFNDAQRGLK